MTEKSEKRREQVAIAREVARTQGLLRTMHESIFEIVKYTDEILLLSQHIGIGYGRYPDTRVNSMTLKEKGIDIKEYEEARENILKAIRSYRDKTQSQRNHDEPDRSITRQRHCFRKLNSKRAL